MAQAARPPVPDRAAARALGDALRRLGYTEDALLDLLGEDAYDDVLDRAPVHERRLPRTRLGTVIRLCFLEQPVSAANAVDALGGRGVEALAATALAEVGETIVPRARITPVEELLLASDGLSRELAEDPPDYVAGYTPTGRQCDLLTPRLRVKRAVDLATGNGVHALLAARHSRHVVATDVNPRALGYTELNAALNGLTNVECRSGSLFEPVEDERFDLIVCNAPFVVSPERRWAYRDAGFHADEFSEQLVRGAAERLVEGGYATMLASWVAPDEEDPHARPLEWLRGSGCDAWIISLFEADPLDHAAEWNSHLAGDPDAFGAALDAWTRALQELGVRRVTEGAVLLHRRPGTRHSVRTDEVDPEELEVADGQIRRAFASRAQLAELRRRDDLLDARLAVADRIRVETVLEPRRAQAGAELRVVEGIPLTVEAAAEEVELLRSLDGSRTLRESLDALELSPRLRRRAPDLCRELLEVGMLMIRKSPL